MLRRASMVLWPGYHVSDNKNTLSIGYDVILDSCYAEMVTQYNEYGQVCGQFINRM